MYSRFLLCDGRWTPAVGFLSLSRRRAFGTPGKPRRGVWLHWPRSGMDYFVVRHDLPPERQGSALVLVVRRGGQPPDPYIDHPTVEPIGSVTAHAVPAGAGRVF